MISCIWSEGFDLDVLLEGVSGFVWFIGEGDCSLSVQCAKKRMLKEADEVSMNRLAVGCTEKPTTNDSQRSSPYGHASSIVSRWLFCYLSRICIFIVWGLSEGKLPKALSSTCKPDQSESWVHSFIFHVGTAEI